MPLDKDRHPNRYHPLNLLLRVTVLAAILLYPSYATSESESTLGQPDIDFFGPEIYQAHHQNWKITQHDNGNIYAANSSGILEFDGEEWQHLSTPQLTFVYDLAIEGGRIYAGSNGNLGYFEKDSFGYWQFNSLKSLLQVEANSPTDIEQIYRVISTPSGIYFLGAKFLYRYHETSLVRTKLKNSDATTAISWFNETLLLGTDEGEIHAYDIESNTIDDSLNFDVLKQKNITEFSKTNSGDVLITTSTGIYKLSINLGNQQFVIRPILSTVNDWIAEHSATSAIELRNGNIAVGSNSGGAVIVSPEGEKVFTISRSSGLKHTRVTGLSQDDQGGLWLTHDGGISRVALELGFYRFDQTDDFINVEAIEQFNGEVFAGSRTQGLFQLTHAPNDDSRVNFKRIFDYQQVWSFNQTETELLVGHESGVDIFVFKQGEITAVQRLAGINRAFSITKVGDQSFFATHEIGVAKIFKTNGSWQISNRILDEQIDHAVFEPPNSLWLGGLYQQYIRLRNIEAWPDVTIDSFGEAEGIPLGSTDLIEIDNKPVFIAENGVLNFEGLNPRTTGRFRPDPAFRTFSQQKQVEYPYPALQVGSNTLFLALNNTLVTATKNNQGEYSVTNVILNDADYGRINQFHETNNTIWIASERGVFSFNTSLLQQRQLTPTLTLKTLSTNTGVVHYLPANARYRTVSGLPITVTDPDKLPSNTKTIELSLALNSFKNAAQNEFRWRKAESWSDWQTEGSIAFQNLPTGRHSIQFQGRTSTGILSKPVTLQILIAPYWYETLLFRLLIIGFSGLCLYLFVKYLTHRRTLHLKQEKKRLQELVDIKTSELQMTDVMKTQFFCNITHEIRTPLTLNIGIIEQVTEENPDLDSKIQQQLHQASTNAKRLLFLVNQVLDINRYAITEDQLNSSTHDLGRFVGWVIERFQPLASQRNIVLSFLKPSQPIGVSFDSGKMERIIVNLLSNSFKFTGPEGEIRIKLTQEVDSVLLSVRDTGVGIPPEQLPFIFDRFYSQNKKQKLEYASTGIGLSIVKSLVELHGGKISVSNTKPMGCCFSLRFPKSDLPISDIDFSQTYYVDDFIDISQPAVIPATETYSIEHEYPDKKSILVIDDNAELRQFIVQVFGQDYLILEAKHGQEGLEIAREFFPDLIICDLMMPVMDGVSFTQTCKNDDELAFIPIFLLTANGSESSRSTSFEVGADDYLEKPFELKEFRSKIRNFLTTQEKLREHIKAEKAEASLPAIERAPNAPEPSEFVAKARAFVIENIYNEVSVESLAEHFNTDRSNLYRHIHKDTNLSTQNFIKDIRLTVAAELLTTTEDNISTIAYRLGFNNLSYFTRSFKAKHHCTPNQFRTKT